MKLSANLSFMFTEHSTMVERYKAAKSAGFSAVECAFPYNEDLDTLAQALSDNGLDQVLLNTVPGDNLGYGARKGEEDLFLASMKTSLEYCKGLGVKKLHIMAGKMVDGVDKREAMEIFKNNLM